MEETRNFDVSSALIHAGGNDETPLELVRILRSADAGHKAA